MKIIKLVEILHFFFPLKIFLNNIIGIYYKVEKKNKKKSAMKKENGTKYYGNDIKNDQQIKWGMYVLDEGLDI